jgi:hypothetical protein
MANHPTISASELTGQVTESLKEIQTNGLVHGGLIIGLILNLLAFNIYSASRRTSSLAVKTAMVTYLFSTLFMAIAALMNGFIFPAFLNDIATNQSDLLQYTPIIKTYSWNINQTLAGASVLGTSAAIILWSIDLLNTNLMQKLVAILGVFIGLIICLSMLSGQLHLGLEGMAYVVFAQNLWYIAFACLLFPKKLIQT